MKWSVHNYSILYIKISISFQRNIEWIFIGISTEHYLKQAFRTDHYGHLLFIRMFNPRANATNSEGRDLLRARKGFRSHGPSLIVNNFQLPALITIASSWLYGGDMSFGFQYNSFGIESVGMEIRSLKAKIKTLKSYCVIIFWAKYSFAMYVFCKLFVD